MNPELKNLRVAVVPCNCNNNIDQRSTIEEVLACKETQLYSVFDYFQAQNDEDLPLLHWSFIFDITNNMEYTGSNTDGIDYFSEKSETKN